VTRWVSVPVLLALCLSAGMGCGVHVRRTRVIPVTERPPWEEVGRAFAKDLAANFRDPPTIVIRPLAWKRASLPEKKACAETLARVLTETTGWRVTRELPGEGLHGPVLEVAGRVRREGGLLGTSGEEIVEFTVRLAGETAGTGPPWTAAYSLGRTCSGPT